MFKIHQKYTDFDGNEREEDLYFNFTEPQLRDFLDKEPSFSEENLANLMAAKDKTDDPKVRLQMLEAIQKLIVAAYGERVNDGKVFKKNKEITENFECSAAFAQLMDDIMYKGDVKTVESFITNIFPAKFASAIRDEMNKVPKGPEVIEKVTGEVVG